MHEELNETMEKREILKKNLKEEMQKRALQNNEKLVEIDNQND